MLLLLGWFGGFMPAVHALGLCFLRHKEGGLPSGCFAVFLVTALMSPAPEMESVASSFFLAGRVVGFLEDAAPLVAFFSAAFRAAFRC